MSQKKSMFNIKNQIQNKIENIKIYTKNLNKKSIFLSILFIILILSFAISGAVNSMFADKNWVVKINNEYISRKNFENDLHQLQKIYPYQDKNSLKQSLLNRITIEKVVELEAKKHGFEVNDKMIQTIIKNDPKFQSNQSFSSSLFKNFLLQNKISERDYYQKIKTDLLKNIIFTFANDIVTFDRNTAILMIKSQKEMRYFDFYEKNISDIDVFSNPSNEEMAKFYNSNKQNFTIPAKKIITYFTIDDIMQKFPINKNEIEYIHKNNPKIKIDDIKKTLLQQKKQQIANNILNSIQSTSQKEIFENLLISYNIKSKTKTIIINEKSSDAKYLYDTKIGQIGVILDEDENDNHTIALVTKIEYPVQKNFEESIQQIKQEILMEKKNSEANNILKELNNSISTNKQIILKKYKFKNKMGQKALRESFNKTIPAEIIKQIFLGKIGYFSESIKTEDKIFIGFLKNIIPDNNVSEEEIAKMSDQINQSKIMDIYELYYKNLQKKYKIEYNKNYFE